MIRRTAVVAAWLVLVLACSSGVWAVIRTAGEDVTTAPSVSGTSSDLGTLLPAPIGASTSPVSPRRPHRATPSPTPGRTATAPSRPSAPSTAATASSPRPAPTRSTPAPEPAEVRRTWQGAAGAVVAGCRGGVIAFRGAQANAGWHVDVEERGPEKVQVHFERGEDAGEVEVESRCSGGAPRFAVSGG